MQRSHTPIGEQNENDAEGGYLKSERDKLAQYTLWPEARRRGDMVRAQDTGRFLQLAIQ